MDKAASRIRLQVTMAHDLVTELLQYSSLACFMPIWQLCANLLIPNCLRSNLSYSPLAAFELYVNFISSKLMSMRFGWTAEQVKYAPQAYFLCRTIGAFIGTFLLTRIAEIKYFRANILMCVVVLLLLMFIDDSVVDILCIGAIGFFGSSVFSIIYSMALQARPDKANQISGLMITAIAGGGVVSPIIGFAMGKMGVIGGVGVILLCVLYLTYCAFGIEIKTCQ